MAWKFQNHPLLLYSKYQHPNPLQSRGRKEWDKNEEVPKVLHDFNWNVSKKKTVMKRAGAIWCSSYLHFAQRVKIKSMDIFSVSFQWWALLKRNHESGTEATLFALNHNSDSKQVYLLLTWPVGVINPCQVLRDLQDGLAYRSWLHYPNHEFLLRADFFVVFAIFATPVCNPITILLHFGISQTNNFVQLNIESSLPRRTWGYLWWKCWTRTVNVHLQPRKTNRIRHQK